MDNSRSKPSTDAGAHIPRSPLTHELGSLSGPTWGAVAKELQEQLRLIRDRIPIDYLRAHDIPGATGPTAALDLAAAVKDFSDARWRLIDRVKAAEALNADLLEALKEIDDLDFGIAGSIARAAIALTEAALSSAKPMPGESSRDDLQNNGPEHHG